MSTDIDVSRGSAAGRRRRLIWLAVLLVIALGGLFALNRAGAFGSSTPAGTAGLDGFRGQLSAKVVNVLERMPAKDHGHANHGDQAGASTMVCGVRVFGIDPAGADSLDEVTRVYAYHMCAVPERGREWIMAVKLTGPAVVTLVADPPTVEVAEGGEGFQERVRSLFPKDLLAEALDENLTPDGMRELIDRYNDAAGL